MKIVIDSNRVIAAIIKDSTTRKIIFDDNFEFVAPDFIKNEINKHSEYIIKSADITTEEFEILLSVIFERITILSDTEYHNFLNACKDIINDEKDIPYMAACLATNASGIWTHDPHFLAQDKVKVFTNIDMLTMSKNFSA